MKQWATGAGAGLALVLAAVVGAWGAAAAVTVETNGLAIGLTAAPSPPARGEATTFEITIRDAAGKPVSGARVSLNLKMAGMAMEENRPRVHERGAGRYATAGTFSMGGEWLAAVEVLLPDGRRAQAEFPLRVR